MEGLIPGQWLELFKGLDLAALVMLSVIAFALERATKISDAQTILLLLVGGALWGGIDGLRTYGSDQPLTLFIAFVAKGVLMNAGGAYLIAQGVSVGLQKLIGATGDKPNG